MPGKSYGERNRESIEKTGKSLYERRVESGQARGLSRSQARGHAREMEASAREVREYRQGIGGIIDRAKDFFQAPHLPPSMFGGRGRETAEEREKSNQRREIDDKLKDASREFRHEHSRGEFDKSTWDDIKSPDFDSIVDKWNTDPNSFSSDTWSSMIRDIYNVSIDEEGNWHFDFDWSSDDGRYEGTGHV